MHGCSRLYPRLLQTIYRGRKREATLWWVDIYSSSKGEEKEEEEKRTSYQRVLDLSGLDGALEYVYIWKIKYSLVSFHSAAFVRNGASRRTGNVKESMRFTTFSLSASALYNPKSSFIYLNNKYAPPALWCALKGKTRSVLITKMHRHLSFIYGKKKSSRRRKEEGNCLLFCLFWRRCSGKSCSKHHGRCS